jgi:hypothetical protein
MFAYQVRKGFPGQASPIGMAECVVHLIGILTEGDPIIIFGI